MSTTVSPLAWRLAELSFTLDWLGADSIALYGAFSEMKGGAIEGYDELDGHDLAVDLKRQLRDLLEAVEESCDNFRALLIAERISQNPEKFINPQP